MFKRLLFVVFLLAFPTFADDYAMYFSYVGTATGAASSSAQKQIGTSVAYHKLAWNKSGTVSKCGVVVEQSATGTSGWTDLITAQTCTSSGTSTIFGASANYVRITFSTPVTGTGSVTASYSGYINLPLTDPPLFASWTAKAFVYSNALKQAVTTAAPTDGQLLIGKTGDVPVLGSVVGTTNQITSTPGAGTITLSTPQDIATTSTPQFARVGAGQAADATAPFAGTIDSATTNTILDVAKFYRTTTGTAGNGIGTGFALYAEDASGNIEEAGRFQASFPVAAHATQTGRVDITVMGLPGGSLATAGSTAWGVNAGQGNSGANQTATGVNAGRNNTGASQTSMGGGAGQNNTGDYQTTTGVGAGYANSGVYQTSMGFNAGYYNTGANQTTAGVNAGQYNTGANQTTAGASAGQYNTGANQTTAGGYAGQYNTGAYQTTMGVNAGQYNNWPNITRIGYRSSIYFPDDAGSLKNITEASITAANTITYVAHGFGTPGGKVNVRYLLTGGAPPVGLVHDTIYQFTVTSADVLTLSGIAFPAAAFTGTLNNSTDTSNSIAIGVDANPTKANQAVLGPSSITETVLRGNVGIGISGVPGAALARLHVEPAAGLQGAIINENGAALATGGLIGGSPALLTLEAGSASPYYQLGYIADGAGSIANYQVLDGNYLQFDHSNSVGSLTGSNWLESYGGHGYQSNTSDPWTLYRRTDTYSGLGEWTGGKVSTNNPLPLINVFDAGTVRISSPSTLGSDSLNETAFTTHAKWDVTGDFDDTGGNATYTHNTGVGTLTQTAVNMLVAGAANRFYRFPYLISGLSGDVACTITTTFAAEATPLNLTAGAQTTDFLSAAVPGSFVVSCTSTLPGGVTLDDVSLKPVAGGDLVVDGSITTAKYKTLTNCADGTATPADCAAAPAGAVIISATATSVVVNTTAVTADSNIILTRDDGLGTRLGVTCNTQSTLVLGTPRVTARTAATSFTVSIDVAPTTNPMCLSYLIFN